MDSNPPFRLAEPGTLTSGAVFSSPHSGSEYPVQLRLRSRLAMPALRASEDVLVDELFGDAPLYGAPLLAATAPRAWLDLNRAPTELDPALIEGIRPQGLNQRVAAGLGVVPRVVSEGAEIYRGKIRLEEAEDRIREIHLPYHRALESLMTRAREVFGTAVLFDCHSCHHPMAEKRNTAARLKAGPGWVRLNDASLLMLRHIARRVDTAGAAAFEAQVERLHKSIASRNDGIAQAKAMIQTLDALLVRIGTHRFSHDDLRAILSSLINDGLGGQYADYQGAEQASMAVQSVADMLRRRGELRTSGLGPAMRKLMNSVAADEQYRAADFQAALRDLRVALTAGAKQ